MSVRRRKGSPFYWYDFTLNGVRFRGSTGETKRAAARAVEAGIRSDAAQKRTYRDDWRVRELFGAYWSEHGQNITSRDDIMRALTRMSKYFGADREILDITPDLLFDYRASRRGDGLELHTVNRDFTYLRAALRWADKVHGIRVPALPWKDIRAKEPPGRDRFLSHDEYGALMDAAHTRIRPIIAFAVFTGLRKANVLSLTWQQIDLQAGRVSVVVKGDKRHVVKLAPPARAVISALPRDRELVFDTQNFRKLWDKAVRDAGLSNFRFHDLRHTFASWARQNGADLPDICEALGHSDISVTMRYAHIKPDEHVTAFDRVASAFTAQFTAHNETKVR